MDDLELFQLITKLLDLILKGEVLLCQLLNHVLRREGIIKGLFQSDDLFLVLMTL